MCINSVYYYIYQGQCVMDVVYGNGFELFSGFNECFWQIFFGSLFENEGKCVIYIYCIISLLGFMYVCVIDEGVCLLEFIDCWMLEIEFKDLCKCFNVVILLGINYYLEQLE